MTHSVKRLLAMLITVLVLIAVVPVAFPGSWGSPVLYADAATDKYVRPTADSTAAVELSTANDWLHFANDSTGSDGTALFKGKTVRLLNDIDLSNIPADGAVAKPVPSVKGFEGTFDGQNHIITIPDGGQFYGNGAALGADAGLFRQVNNEGCVKNLIVQLKGQLLLPNSGSVYNAGVIAGSVLRSSKLENVAVIGVNKNCKLTITYPVTPMIFTSNRYYGTVAGYLAGDPASADSASGGSTLSGCYSDISLSLESPVSIFPQSKAYLGGIIGFISGDSSAVRDCSYRGQSVGYQALKDLMIQVDIGNQNVAVQTVQVYIGGISGYAANSSKLENCFVYQPAFKFNHLLPYSIADTDYLPLTVPQYAGKIVGAKNATALVSNCFGIGTVTYTGTIMPTAPVAENSGSASAAPKAATLGTNWLDTLEDLPNVKWLVNAPTNINVDAKSESPTLAITPNYPNSDGSYDATTDANWVFDINVPVKGTMATPAGIITEAAVGSVEVTSSATEYYKGGTYYFGATVKGPTVATDKPAVTWSAKDNTGAAVEILATGGLVIPSTFAADSITVTAACKGVTKDFPVTVKQQPISITLEKNSPPTLPLKPLQGQSLSLQATGGGNNYTWKSGSETLSTTNSYTYTVPSNTATKTITVTSTPPPGGSEYSGSFSIQPQTSSAVTTTHTNDATTKAAVVKITEPSQTGITGLSSLKNYFKYSTDGSTWKKYDASQGIAVSETNNVLYLYTDCTGNNSPDTDYKESYLPSKQLKYTFTFESDGTATYTLDGTVAAAQSPSSILISNMPYLIGDTSSGMVPPPNSFYISSINPSNKDTILKYYNYAHGTSYERGAGTITVKSVRASKLPFTTDTTNRFMASVQEISSSGGQVTARPFIHPGAGETIDPTQGIWITNSGSDPAQIYYTITPDGTATTAQNPGTTTEDGRTRLFKSGDKILFPESSDTFEVRALAVDSVNGKAPSDIVTILYRRDSSFQSPDTPVLLLGDTKQNYSYEQTYPAESTIHFETPGASEFIYFTINGSTPTTSSTKYDPNNPVKLTSVSGRTSVTVMAMIYNSVTKRSSAVATYIVRIMQNLGMPAASLDQARQIRPNQELLLSLSDDTLKQLDSNGTFLLKRVTYQYTDATNNTDYNEFGSEVPVTGSPIAGTDYVSYREDSSTNFALPDIKYLVGTGDVTTSGLLYTYGIRKISYSADSGYTVTYTNPQVIKLSAAPGESVTVQAYTISPNTQFKNSATATYTYKVRGAVSAPTAYPPTDNAQLAALKVGDGVVLASSANTKIFYTLDSSLPAVSYDPASKSWVPQNESTLEFTDNIDITSDMVTKRIFAINAIAVHISDELESSPPTTFRYRLPDPVKAVIANPSGGAVIKDTKVKLSCLTEGATIYYTTDGVTQPGASADQVYIYDPENPPVIKKDVTIITRAEKEGVSSDVKTYAFTMSPVLPAPLASLPTGSAVCKGTRIKLSAQGSIAYTIDGSDPKAAVAAGGEEASAVNYGDSVVLDADYGKSITIRAYATRDGYSPSEVASYTYTICKQEDYLTAVPVSGQTIIAGTTITLSTSVTNGKIYYATDGNVPIAANVYTDDVDEDDEDDDDDSVSTYDGEFKWAAGSKTSRGNTVKASGNPGDTFTVRALVVADGSQNGTISLFTYKLTERTPSPTASIPSGAITLSGAEVTLTGKEGDIFYTTDGTTPTTSSTLYTKPIPITDSIVLKAIAIAKDKVASEVVEYTYTRAGQAAAVTMSVPSGEVEQGTKLELKSETGGAAIYYTTDGSEPGKSSLVYSAPISLMRPVTIKAIAVMEGLDDSVVNSASYTVTEPVPVEEETDNASQVQTTQTDRLESRRTYAKSGQGNTYTDVVITEPQYNVVLSCTDGIVPQDAQLDIKQVDSSAGEKKAVNSLLGYNIAALYDVNLLKGGEAIQPTGQVEVGIPIPAEYQNGIVVVCRINDDGTAEAFPTRRSGGVAYFMTNHFSRYAVTVPELSRGNISTNFTVIVIASAAVTLLFVLILILVLRRKHVKKKKQAQG